MKGKLKYLFALLLISSASVAQKPDSLVKKNSFILDIYGGFLRTPRSNSFSQISGTLKKDNSVLNPLLGISIQYERKLKNTHYILLGLSYFNGQYAVTNKTNYINTNNNPTVLESHQKLNCSYYNTECSYRKRWHLGKQNKYNLIADVGIYSTLHFKQTSNYNYITYTNGLVTETSSYKYDSYNNGNLINTRLNFNIVNRLGLEKKLKKTSISLLFSNYIPTIYIYEYSPYSFNPLLTLQLHV